MRLATAAEMRELDRKTIEEYGIPGVVLMENAGRGLVDEVVRKWGAVTGKKFVIFCGKGNNGGDGLVIARHLHNMGAKVAVRIFSDDMKSDAGVNLSAAKSMGLDVKTVSEDLAAETSAVRHADIVVDAIFGTGLASAVGEPYRGVIEMVNANAQRVVSVDIPSGVDSDRGHVMGCAVHAHLTATFGLPKRGLYLYPGSQFAGEVRVVDISIPAEAVAAAPIKAGLLTAEAVSGFIPRRGPDTHKGTYGHLFILAGSVGKTGAAVLAAQAALRSGAGLVTVGVPESLNGIFEEKLTEAMTVPLPETPERSLASSGLERILEELEGKSAVAIGPGMSTNTDTAKLVESLLPRLKVPMLIDADGLNILALHDHLAGLINVPAVLTPHPGEMGRLLGVLAREVQADRPAAALDLAAEVGKHVVLKGARTLIASPDGEFWINPTGNPGMATAGTGDVLTGIISSFIAQGLSVMDAARLGVYVHGLAGDLAASDKGQSGLIAGDIIDMVPNGLTMLSGH
ncbi:MAG: NAD(P)H-hydrate dehydratase [Nitrospirae bacterium]|nr:NAD(P)H-hydrate dehydratase [Nitrospirota bacterium]